MKTFSVVVRAPRKKLRTAGLVKLALRQSLRLDIEKMQKVCVARLLHCSDSKLRLLVNLVHRPNEVFNNNTNSNSIKFYQKFHKVSGPK